MILCIQQQYFCSSTRFSSSKHQRMQNLVHNAAGSNSCNHLLFFILYYWQNKIDILFMGKNMYDKRMFFYHLLSTDLFNSPLNYTSFKRGRHYK